MPLQNTEMRADASVKKRMLLGSKKMVAFCSWQDAVLLFFLLVARGGRECTCFQCGNMFLWSKLRRATKMLNIFQMASGLILKLMQVWTDLLCPFLNEANLWPSAGKPLMLWEDILCSFCLVVMI